MLNFGIWQYYRLDREEVVFSRTVAPQHTRYDPASLHSYSVV